MSKWPISLAQWSLHRNFEKGELDPINFPAFACSEFGLQAVEYVNIFYRDQLSNRAYFRELRQRSDDQGVKNVLIMCDGLGAIGAPEKVDRIKTVEAHRPWLEVASMLGCHGIRVNAESEGDSQEQKKLVMDGLAHLAEVADEVGLNILVENHWGLSSNATWLVSVIEGLAHKRVGALPDFGNFEKEDRIAGVKALLPFAFGVSAKSYDFDDKGEETEIPYGTMLRFVRESNYDGYIGIEYEGDRFSERDGILRTLNLIQKYSNRLVGCNRVPN